MTWKTRGTVRREAAGIKRIEEYLEFSITDRHAEINGITHTTQECSSIQKGSYFRRYTFWEDQSRPESIRCKIGRGAWVNVKTAKQCPHCSPNKED